MNTDIVLSLLGGFLAGAAWVERLMRRRAASPASSPASSPAQLPSDLNSEGLPGSGGSEVGEDLTIQATDMLVRDDLDPEGQRLVWAVLSEDGVVCMVHPNTEDKARREAELFRRGGQPPAEVVQVFRRVVSRGEGGIGQACREED